MDDLKAIIESLLFISDTPLTVDKIKTILEIEDRKRIQDVITGLSGEYDEQQRAFFIAEIAGGYQMRTRPQYAVWARKLKQSKPPRLSRAAMETLAIIAYKQPCIRTDIEHLRGVDCGGVLHMLLERGIIRTLGRKDLPGRPLVYGTSKRFLEIFDLKDLKNLPTLKDIQKLGEIWPSDAGDSTREYETHEASASDGGGEETAGDLLSKPHRKDLEGDWPEESVSDSEQDEEQWPEELFGDGEDATVDWPDESDEEGLEDDSPEESATEESDQEEVEDWPEESPEESAEEFDDNDLQEQEESWPNDSN